MMSDKPDLNSQIEILKALGHKSRTLLNGVTGPVQIIRSLSDEPKLIEPLRILELTVSRFERFSFRSLMLSDLLQSNKISNPKPFDFIDVFRYVVLDFTDLLDFYNLKIDLENNKSVEVTSDYDLLSHCIMIIFEQVIAISNEGNSIKVRFDSANETACCTITCPDKGLVQRSLNSVLSASGYPSDIDLYLLKFGVEVLKAKLNLTLSTNIQTVIKLELPYTYRYE